MASYFSPELFSSDPPVGSNSSKISRIPETPESSRSSSRESLSLSDISIERLRGTPASTPAFLFREEAHLEFAENEEAEDFDDIHSLLVLRNSNKTLREQRKVPGCGINEFDPKSESVRALHSPVNMEQLFGRETKTYLRPRLRPRLPNLYPYGAAAILRGQHADLRHEAPLLLPASAILDSSESQRKELKELEEQRRLRMVRDPRYPMLTRPLSPYTSTSSSSSSVSSLEEFHPILQSSAINMRTPPHQRYIDTHRIRHGDHHPAFIPSWEAVPPESYLSPSSSDSDISVFPPTPQPPRQTNLVAPRRPMRQENAYYSAPNHK